MEPPPLNTFEHKTLAHKFLEKSKGRKDCELTREMLADFAGVQTKFYTDRLFTLIQSDGNRETIKFSEFYSFVVQYKEGTEDSKTGLLFQIYDTNGDGRLGKKELVEMLRVSMKENKLELDKSLLNDLATTLLEEGLGVEEAKAENAALKLEDFRKLFHGHKELITNLSTIIEKWLQPIPEVDKANQKGTMTKKCKNLLHWFQYNCAFTFWVALFFFINATLFAVRIVIFCAEEKKDIKVFLGIARGFGWCLDFSSGFILFTMMRQALTKLRATPLFNVFPIDDHKQFHRIVGKFIVFASFGHAIAHIINVKITVDDQKEERRWNYLSYMTNPQATQNLGLLPGFAYIIGLILIIVLVSMFIFTFSFVRRNGCFHAFYISHMICYPLYYILLVLHCKNFWKWFIFPGIIFAMEQVFRTYNNFIGFATTVRMGIILPSKVTNLVLARPPGFNFNPGDYLFIKLPQLSRFEWHAFTISSAPENMDELSLHIRAVGPWTETLYNFYNYLKKRSNIEVIFPNGAPATKIYDPTKLHHLKIRSKLMRSNKLGKHFGKREIEMKSMVVNNERNPLLVGSSFATLPRNFAITTVGNYRYETRKVKSVIIGRGDVEEALLMQQGVVPPDNNGSVVQEEGCTRINAKPLIAYIDGPYGASCSEIFRAEHAVLIGAGIGVTPFASILQSIMYRHWDAKISCPKCSFTFSHGFHSQLNRLKKVDFFWLNPEQNAFSWFVNLLSKLEIEQEELGGNMDRFLDIHMYMTKALQRHDMKAVALQLALDLFYEKHHRDCLAKLKTRMNAGRPNWKKVFSKIKENKKGPVSIFFCGPKPLGDQLEELCAEYGFNFRTESF